MISGTGRIQGARGGDDLPGPAALLPPEVERLPHIAVKGVEVLVGIVV
jgi:hypothetical protein